MNPIILIEKDLFYSEVRSFELESRHESDTFDGKILFLFGGHLGKLELTCAAKVPRMLLCEHCHLKFFMFNSVVFVVLKKSSSAD